MADQFGNYVPGLKSAGKTIATLEGNGSPVGVVTTTADAAVYFDKTNNTTWEWSGSAWVELG
jgi:hypothetical protein